MAEISGRPITPAQIRAIKVAQRRQGIDDDTYRAMLQEHWGVDSCKGLTRREASDLLRRLGRALKNPPGARKPRPRRPRADPAEGATRLASGPQRELISKLAAEIAWREGDGYTRWLRGNMGLERVATSAQALRVIEGLKAIKRRGGE